MLKQRNIHFLDIGISGGLEGACHGASLMIGGEKAAFEWLISIFEAIGTKWLLVCRRKRNGAFTKMVHNGIEYAMLEAYGEGLELLVSALFKIDTIPATSAWVNGGVIRSWILELAERAI